MSLTQSSNFNPLPSCEGRQRSSPRPRMARGYFNPLPSCEGRPRQSAYAFKLAMISIHSPHARGDATHRVRPCDNIISIHSPHARGDQDYGGVIMGGDISIHSPHTRGDSVALIRPRSWTDFKPLPSYEGRPESQRQGCRKRWYFNPLPSCEGRRRSEPVFAGR